GGIGTFQWVTAEKIKKFSWSPTRLPGCGKNASSLILDPVFAPRAGRRLALVNRNQVVIFSDFVKKNSGSTPRTTIGLRSGKRGHNIRGPARLAKPSLIAISLKKANRTPAFPGSPITRRAEPGEADQHHRPGRRLGRGPGGRRRREGHRKRGVVKSVGLEREPARVRRRVRRQQRP